MSNTTIIRTQFEYSVMDIQRYEFTCSGCFTIKSIADYGLRGVTLCKECSA
jgi:hypothetical protein